MDELGPSCFIFIARFIRCSREQNFGFLSENYIQNRPESEVFMLQENSTPPHAKEYNVIKKIAKTFLH